MGLVCRFSFLVMVASFLSACSITTSDQIEEILAAERRSVEQTYQSIIREKDTEIQALKDNMRALAAVEDCIELREDAGETFLEPIC